MVKDLTKNNKIIVTVEEHNIIGGLGSAVSEVMSSIKNECRLVRIGIDDFYSPGGSYESLKNTYGLSVEKIIKTISSNLNNEK